MAILAIMIFCICFLPGCGPAGNGRSGSRKPAVTVSEAKKAALDAAEVDEKDAVITRRKLVREADSLIYLICFTVQSENENTRYEYSIDGDTGQVIGRDKKVQTAAPANIGADIAGIDEASDEGSEDFIGVKKAKHAVFQDSGLSAEEVRFTSVRLVNRAGRMRYVAEFISADVNYVFEIDAYNGRVTNREVEYDD